MNEENKMWESDGRFTSSQQLTVYSSNKNTVGVRLENYGIFSSIIYIQERSKTDVLKFDFDTLMCLREALNMLHDNTFKDR